MELAARILSFLALALLLISVVWTVILGVDDWGALLPLWLALFVAGPLAAAGLICALVARLRDGREAVSAWVIVIDLVVIGLPWAALGLAG